MGRRSGEVIPGLQATELNNSTVSQSCRIVTYPLSSTGLHLQRSSEARSMAFVQITSRPWRSNRCIFQYNSCVLWHMRWLLDLLDNLNFRRLLLVQHMHLNHSFASLPYHATNHVANKIRSPIARRQVRLLSPDHSTELRPPDGPCTATFIANTTHPCEASPKTFTSLTHSPTHLAIVDSIVAKSSTYNS